ncbi:MAG: hypothetical protein U5K69_21800 [Balneolaceae bacterium]|nr:hypothetical protein [Balneolaceae bacterium]
MLGASNIPAASEIEVFDLKFNVEDSQSSNTATLSGRIKNNSDSELNGLTISVKIHRLNKPWNNGVSAKEFLKTVRTNKIYMNSLPDSSKNMWIAL